MDTDTDTDAASQKVRTTTMAKLKRILVSLFGWLWFGL
jgi:hypothetical protein